MRRRSRRGGSGYVVKILRGRFADLDVAPHQFGVDWITATHNGEPLTYNGQQVTLRPDNVQLTTDADRAVFAPDARRDGVFWDCWELTPDGLFVRKATPEELTRPRRRRPGAYIPIAHVPTTRGN